MSLELAAEVSMQMGAHVRAEVRKMQPCPPSQPWTPPKLVQGWMLQVPFGVGGTLPAQSSQPGDQPINK